MAAIPADTYVKKIGTDSYVIARVVTIQTAPTRDSRHVDYSIDSPTSEEATAVACSIIEGTNHKDRNEIELLENILKHHARSPEK